MSTISTPRNDLSEMFPFACSAYEKECAPNSGQARRVLSKLIVSLCAPARTLVGVALCIAPVICEANAAEPYALVNSGFPSHERYQPFWIDNDRLIFRGYQPGSYDEEVRKLPIPDAAARGYEYTGMKTGYYIWNTRTGDIALYKDRIDDLCAEGELVVYRTIPAHAKDKSIVWRGRMGAEKPTQISPKVLSPRSNGIPRECWNFYPEPGKNENKGRAIRKLRPEFGYLDLGPADHLKDSSPHSAALYYHQGANEGIELSIQRHVLRGARFHFAAHEGRYLIEERTSNTSMVQRAWFLTEDGKVDAAPLPDGPWSSINLYPVRNALFLSALYIKGKGMGSPGGAYLIRGKDWRLLFTGRKGPVGVSPDGCKVALSVAPTRDAYRKRLQEWIAGRPGEQTIRAITICERVQK